MNPAVVLGGADCVLTDYEALLALVPADWPHIVIAVNEAAIYFRGHIDHWVSLHPNKFSKWQQERKGAWVGGAPVRWSHEDRALLPYVDRQVPLLLGGSSGLFAANEVAHLALGLEPVFCCGVPIDARPHIGRPGKWNHYSGFKNAWTLHADEFRPWLCSMSGYTRELLGGPERFLTGNERKAA